MYSRLYKDSGRTRGLKNKKAFLSEIVHIINDFHVGHALYHGLVPSFSKDIACCLIVVFIYLSK